MRNKEIIQKHNRKAQITLFVIAGIAIVAIGLFFLFLKPKIITPGINMQNPESYVQSCVGDELKQAIRIISEQGGYFSPQNYKLYNNTKIAYLCYTPLWFEPCVNQEPMFIEHLKSEIKEIISPKVEFCFDSLKQNLESRNYNVEMKDTSFDVELNPKKASAKINKEISMNKNEENQKFDKFNVEIISPIYNLANIAVEIVNGEAKECEFDYLAYKNKHSEFNIVKTFAENNTKIYIIGNEVKLNIATRSCAMPGGML